MADFSVGRILIAGRSGSTYGRGVKKSPAYDQTMQIEMESTQADSDLETSTVGSLDRLKDQFAQILRDEAIFYPVAYRFTHELGRGRQGIVFQGMRHGARGCITRHAIKIFDPSLYSSVERYWTDMGRIADQVSRMQRLNSPHLIFRDIYDEYNGIGYCQMEVIDGLDLDDLLNPEYIQAARHNCSDEDWGRISDVLYRFEGDHVSIQPGIALYILRQALKGLEGLHDQGFLHSDIKPSNIMVTRSGYIKLIDFGRATRIRESSSILFGTPAYMSPEAHRRQPCDVQSDLFSVGLLAIYLLHGRIPDELRRGSEEDILNAKHSLNSRLHKFLPDHVLKNAEFVALLHRFLNPDPSQRFPSAEEAEAGHDGLQLVHKQLTLTGQDTEYGRELQFYLNTLLPPANED